MSTSSSLGPPMRKCACSFDTDGSRMTMSQLRAPDRHAIGVRVAGRLHDREHLDVLRALHRRALERDRVDHLRGEADLLLLVQALFQDEELMRLLRYELVA